MFLPLLVNQVSRYQCLRSAPLGGSRVVYITKYIISLTSNHIFVHFNHYDTFYSDNKGCAQRFINFTDENLKRKVQIEDEFIYIMN